jgi:flagellar assembly protein FliH
MSSSFEATVIGRLASEPATIPSFVPEPSAVEASVYEAAMGTELRTGVWTRLAGGSVLGDGVTESVLAKLADQASASAQAQGYAVGWSQGQKAAEARAREEATVVAARRAEEDAVRAEEHRIAVAALHEAAARLTATTAQVCASVESQAVDIALQVTETLVGRELAVAVDPGADAVRRALSLLPGEPLVTVRLNPADVPSDAVATLAAAGATIVADPTLARGDAIAEAADFVVDASVASALQRVREVLG